MLLVIYCAVNQGAESNQHKPDSIERVPIARSIALPDMEGRAEYKQAKYNEGDELLWIGH